MSGIASNNYKEVDLRKIAVIFFYPDGKIISINKVKGFKNHIDYLEILSASYKEVSEVISNIDLKQYRKSEDYAKMYTEVWPLFSQKGISTFLNIAPNDYMPTDMGLMLLPETISDEEKKTFKNIDNQLLNVILTCIGHYFNEIKEYYVIDNEDNTRISSKALFNIADEQIEEIKVLYKY